MTTPLTGNINLNKVRSDLGLTPGSLIERAVCNRAGFSSAVKPSLEAHRGLAFAPQALITGDLNATMTRRDTGYKGSYPNPSGGWYVTSQESGNDVVVKCATGAGGDDPSAGNLDASVEFRQGYYMPVSGNFRWYGDVTLQQDATYNNMKWDATLLGFTNGYLQGAIKTYLAVGGKGTTATINYPFTSDPSYPYAVMVLRIIGNGGNPNAVKVATFKNVTVKYR